jgi:hypothetical protein
MRIPESFLFRMLFVGIFAIAGLAVPINAQALNVVRLDESLWVSAIHRLQANPVALANPWSEARVHHYLRTARKQYQAVGPVQEYSLFAWKTGSFSSAAGQGRSSSLPAAHEHAKRPCSRCVD